MAEPSVSRLLPLLLPAALLAALMGPASAGASAPAVLVTDSRMTRMVALMDRGASCMPSSDRAYIRRVVLEAPSHMVREMSDAGMDSLMEVCKQHRRGSPGGIIFPGTKWCGTGNIAVGYHDLGEKEAEDSCCREHDNCPSQLGPGECRGGLCNNTPFTTSHCDCDARFRRCLQTVNTDTAHTLGTLFFNVGQVKCFKEQRLCPDTEDPAAPPCPTPELQFRPSGRYSPLPPLF
ncbi:hypothetical protein R5R35_011795 [Gryllus longicercus]|uniref:Phospholipase A2 n=1 Tax=Gryllus longicercus TaxID=2509291 RepID=A0AAN9ZBI9_9ORTH